MDHIASLIGSDAAKEFLELWKVCKVDSHLLITKKINITLPS